MSIFRADHLVWFKGLDKGKIMRGNLQSNRP